MRTLLCLLIATLTPLGAAPPTVEWQTSGTKARLRGVSAFDGKVAWASGTGGTVLRTLDGGITWNVRPVPGAEKLDFRDVEAFSANEATVLSIGPGESSRIYRTRDGGATWTLQFTNSDPKAFYDALAFWTPLVGLAMSDPVDGRFRLITTKDGGRTWTPLEPAMPEILEKESAFAASGTCVAAGPEGRACLLTGGAAKARVFTTRDGGRTWQAQATNQVAGLPSAGLFGACWLNASQGFCVGGDYKEEKAPSSLVLTQDGGRTWQTAGRFPGFRSGIAALSPSTLITVGPSGADISRNGGTTWHPFNASGLHAVSGKGSVAWAVGEDGRIARITP